MVGSANCVQDTFNYLYGLTLINICFHNNTKSLSMFFIQNGCETIETLLQAIETETLLFNPPETFPQLRYVISTAVRYFPTAGAYFPSAGSHFFKINAHFAIAGSPFFNNDTHCLTHDCHSETIVDHFGINECHPYSHECHPGVHECYPDVDKCHPGSRECHPGSYECHPFRRECHPGRGEFHSDGGECLPGVHECHPDGRRCLPGSRGCLPGTFDCHSDEIASHYRTHIHHHKWRTSSIHRAYTLFSSFLNCIINQILIFNKKYYLGTKNLVTRTGCFKR